MRSTTTKSVGSLCAAAIIVMMMSMIAMVVYSEEIIPNSFYKHLQGSPEEFNNFVDPTPAMSSLISDSFMMEIALSKDTEQSNNKYSWKGMVPVDSLEHVAIATVGTDAKYMNLKVLNIDGIIVNELAENVDSYNQAMKTKNHIVNTWMGFEKSNGVPAKIFNFNNDDQVRTGDWIIEVSLDEQAPEEIKAKYNNRESTADIKTDIVLIIYNSSPLTAHTQMLNMKTMVGDKIGFITRVSEKQEIEKREKLGLNFVPKAIPMSSFEHIEAEMDIQSPTGKESIVQMHATPAITTEAGLQALEHEGSFTGEFVATEKGVFHFRVVVKGIVGEEMRSRLFKNAKLVAPEQPRISFMRTTQHVVAVIEKDLELVQTGTVATFNQVDEMMTIKLQAKKLDATAEPKKYKTYAEVWAVSQQDETKLVPVCWSLGMSVSQNSEQGKDFMTVPLQFSMKWLSKAGAKLPLTLKNIKIQDVETSTAVSELSEITGVSTHHEYVNQETKTLKYKVTDQKAVHKFAEMLLESQFKFSKGDQVTETMKMGPRPQQLLKVSSKLRSSAHKVILVHGYCSSGNPFTTAHFQNAIVFSDISKSRSNDQFAQLIWNIAKDLESFSIVAHSQGGMAGVHLYTFYWSTADNVPTDSNIKILQSVGTPYLGCSAAGGIANVGKIFGAGCGTNTDLSPDGASKWIKTIPESSQKKVSYYTTQNEKDGKACQSLMDWVLYRPNDGTSEARYSTLASGNNMGIKYGWCHTDGMTYPSQCTDPDRNAELNKFANGL